MIKIKNSSTNKDVVFDQKKLTIYNCGPTVYNYVHIGNVRPIITMDILYRFAKFMGMDVFYTHNITDVDDKIIMRAKEEKKDELELSRFYYEKYLEVLDALNIKRMDVLPKVTDNIDDIIAFVKLLVSKNKAYIVDGDVYFDLSSAKEYGSVSHQKIENLLEGVRKEKDDKKHYPLDFVLWKKTKEGINWKTEWNDHGRPGWHTECVVLINKYIGNQVDIHGGGVDLKFPHHENEDAQNKAAYDKPLAKCWMHVGHINVNGEKMSKSLNNFVLAKDILAKYEPNYIRWFFYQTTYQSPLNFSFEALDASKAELLKIIKSINNTLINYYWLTNKTNINRTKELPGGFVKALEEDLNLPNGVKEIWSISKALTNLIRTKDIKGLEKALNELLNMFDIFGLKYTNILEDKNIKQLVDNWKASLDTKDYATSDKIRKQLQDKEII